MTTLDVADKVVRLVDEARALPACRESALAVTKLQEAYLWLIEMQAVQARANEEVES